MIITYHGLEFFKVQQGDTTIALNPVGKESKHGGARFGADIAFVTTLHEDMHGADAVTRGDKAPFVVHGPGEYEWGGIRARGVHTGTSYGGRTRNTAYRICIEDVRLGFLGAIDSIDLSEDAQEALENIDILFVPIGGNGVLAPAHAQKLAVMLEPKVIIPMHYDDDKTLATFLKEMGSEDVTPIDKLVTKAKDLAGKEGDVIVLHKEG